MSVRFVPRQPEPDPPEHELWRVIGVRLPVVCLAREHPHGTDLLLLQADELVQTQLIRTGRADVERKAAAWKQALLAKGWTEYPPQ